MAGAGVEYSFPFCCEGLNWILLNCGTSLELLLVDAIVAEWIGDSMRNCRSAASSAVWPSKSHVDYDSRYRLTAALSMVSSSAVGMSRACCPVILCK